MDLGHPLQGECAKREKRTTTAKTRKHLSRTSSPASMTSTTLTWSGSDSVCLLLPRPLAHGPSPHASDGAHGLYDCYVLPVRSLAMFAHATRRLEQHKQHNKKAKRVQARRNREDSNFADCSSVRCSVLECAGRSLGRSPRVILNSDCLCEIASYVSTCEGPVRGGRVNLLVFPIVFRAIAVC